MLASTLSFSLTDVLPMIKNKGEATALISVIVVSQQLSSASRVLQLSIQNEVLLSNLQDDAVKAKDSRFKVALSPLVSSALSLVKQRFSAQVTAINSHLEDLSRINLSLVQYSEQNMALSRELNSAGCAQLSQQKRYIANFELEICERIEKIKSFSRESTTTGIFNEMPLYSPLSLQQTPKKTEIEEEISSNRLSEKDEDEPYSNNAYSNNVFTLFTDRNGPSSSKKSKKNENENENNFPSNSDYLHSRMNTPNISNSTISPSFSASLVMGQNINHNNQNNHNNHNNHNNQDNQNSKNSHNQHDHSGSVRKVGKHQLFSDSDLGPDLRPHSRPDSRPDSRSNSSNGNGISNNRDNISNSFSNSNYNGNNEDNYNTNTNTANNNKDNNNSNNTNNANNTNTNDNNHPKYSNINDISRINTALSQENQEHQDNNLMGLRLSSSDDTNTKNGYENSNENSNENSHENSREVSIKSSSISNNDFSEQKRYEIDHTTSGNEENGNIKNNKNLETYTIYKKGDGYRVINEKKSDAVKNQSTAVLDRSTLTNQFTAAVNNQSTNAVTNQSTPDRAEMSPPAEQRPDNSTPTSSQTVAGDNYGDQTGRGTGMGMGIGRVMGKAREREVNGKEYDESDIGSRERGKEGIMEMEREGPDSCTSTSSQTAFGGIDGDNHGSGQYGDNHGGDHDHQTLRGTDGIAGIIGKGYYDGTGNGGETGRGRGPDNSTPTSSQTAFIASDENRPHPYPNRLGGNNYDNHGGKNGERGAASKTERQGEEREARGKELEKEMDLERERGLKREWGGENDTRGMEREKEREREGEEERGLKRRRAGSCTQGSTDTGDDGLPAL